VPLENHAAEIRHRRFEITAADYAELESKARAQDLILLGFYHTHPDHPARPSATDLAYAWPFFSYIILTVSAGKAGEMAAFVLDEDTMQFVSEQLHKG
jgi:proteasome lid subunit RPN8/RPN11